MEDLTGKQLGPFRIVSPLGEGGMAAVYKAYQPGTDRYVALKVLPSFYAADPQYVERFTREAHLIAGLEHPHILPIYDFGKAAGYTYLAMRLVEGGTLTQLMQRGAVPLAAQRQILVEVGDALDYAHAHGVIHRDIKPGNILLDGHGHCLLADFGLAKVVVGTAHLTGSGALMGTPAYMSPEQCLGEAIDARSDVYALGVVLFEMATGQAPYSAETPVGVILKHVHDPLPQPRALNPALPEAVERVLLKALAKNRDDRYPSAGELARAFRAATAHLQRTAAATGPVNLPAGPHTLSPRQILEAFSGMAAGWALGAAIALSPWAIRGNLSLLSVIGWSIGGLATAWALSRAPYLRLRSHHLFLVTLGWACSWVAGTVLLQAADPTWGLFTLGVWACPQLMTSGMALSGLGAAVTALALRWAQPALRRRQVLLAGLLVTLLWGCGWVLLALAYLGITSYAASLGGTASNFITLAQDYYQLAEALTGALVGLLSADILLWLAQPRRRKKTAHG